MTMMVMTMTMMTVTTMMTMIDDTDGDNHDDDNGDDDAFYMSIPFCVLQLAPHLLSDGDNDDDDGDNNDENDDTDGDNHDDDNDDFLHVHPPLCPSTRPTSLRCRRGRCCTLVNAPRIFSSFNHFSYDDVDDCL